MEREGNQEAEKKDEKVKISQKGPNVIWRTSETKGGRHDLRSIVKKNQKETLPQQKLQCLKLKDKTCKREERNKALSHSLRLQQLHHE